VEETREVLGERHGLIYVHNPYDAVNGADALAVATDWDVYKQLYYIGYATIICACGKRRPPEGKRQHTQRQGQWQESEYNRELVGLDPHTEHGGQEGRQHALVSSCPKIRLKA
jgi:hypothetical protein